MIERHNFIPVFKVWVDHSVGKAFATNTNTFKHTVTSQLVHDKVGVDETCRKNQKYNMNQ